MNESLTIPIIALCVLSMIFGMILNSLINPVHHCTAKEDPSIHGTRYGADCYVKHDDGSIDVYSAK